MISFKILTEENIKALAEELEFDFEETEEVLSSLQSLLEDDVEVGISVSGGCMLVRIFDMGRYSFIYPIMMSDDSDPAVAVEDIRAYAVKEEIPLILTDVPREEMGVLLLFRHAVIDAEDRECGSYRVKIENECSLLEQIPECRGDRIMLSAVAEQDAQMMAKLARDRVTNRYWGYDYLSDVGEVDDGYFYQNAALERARGASLTLAIRREGEYIGEAVLWGFDFLGSAEVALRLLSEKIGNGFGSEALGCVVELAERIGLVRLIGRVDERNKPSLKMMDKFFTVSHISDGVVFYEREL